MLSKILCEKESNKGIVAAPITTGIERRVNLFYMLVFAYFFTLSADVLNLECGLFKLKVNNLLAVGAFLSLLLSKQGLLFPKKVILPFVAILISLLGSSLGSIYPERCLGYCAVYLFEFGVYFLVPYTLLFHFDKEKILKVYFLSFQAIGLYAFLQLLLSMGGIYTPFLRQFIEKGGWARAHGLSYEPSYYALYMCGFVMCFNALYLLSHEKRSLFKLFCANWLLLLSTATSAFFSYFFFIPLAFFFRRYAVSFKKKIIQLSCYIAALILAIGALAPKMAIFFVKFFIFGLVGHHSFSERWDKIVSSLSVFCEHPFLGVGIGGIGPYLYYRENVGIFPGASFGLSLKQSEIYDPANVATEILAGLGLVGVVAFSFLFALVLKGLKTALKLSEKERVMALSLFISLFVMILVLQFNSGLFRCYIWVHMAITLGYTMSSSSNSPPSAIS